MSSFPRTAPFPRSSAGFFARLTVATLDSAAHGVACALAALGGREILVGDAARREGAFHD